MLKMMGKIVHKNKSIYKVISPFMERSLTKIVMPYLIAFYVKLAVSVENS